VKTAEEGERLRAGESRPQERLARHVGDPPVRADGIPPRVDAEQLRAPVARTVQAEQQPDGGRLAGAVGTQVPVHLPPLDREIERVERQRVAVALRQPLRVDHRLHVMSPKARCIGM